MPKPKRQYRIKNNVTGITFDVPEKTYKTYKPGYLFDMKGRPVFTIIETPEDSMKRLTESLPVPPEQRKAGRPAKK